MMLLRFQSVTSASSRRAIASGFRHSATTSLSNCPQSSCLSSSSSSSSQLIQCLPSHFRFLSVVSVAASQQVGRAEEQIRQYLLSQEFKAEQVDRLLPHLIGPVEFVGFKGLDTNSRCQIVQQSINFWKQHLKPIAISKLKINLHKDYVQDAKIQNQFAKNAKYQTILVDHNYVFAYVEPDLLFIDPVLMERRLKMLKNVGFISGNTDLWRVFVICPRGFYLQNWNDFMMKYNYVQYRIMDWLNHRRKETFNQIHPLVQYPMIMEKSYQEIKTRFQFALRCGYRIGNEGNRDFSLTVKALLDTSLDIYLKRVTPGLSEEEFHVFQTMIEQIEQEEDDLFEQVSELGSIQGSKWTTFNEDE